jgi:perosamine synthetase
LKHGVAVNSGTNGIFLALYVWSKRHEDRDEVIVPNWGYPAARRVCMLLGLKVIPVDIRTDTLGMHPNLVREKINSKTLAVIHIENNGIIGKPDEIRGVIPEPVLFIEDSAPSFLQRDAGTYGHVSVFSFSPTKPLMGGEGGIIMTDYDDLYDELVAVRGPDNHHQQAAALNCHLSPFLAAYLIPQFNDLESLCEIRLKVRDRYQEHLNIFTEHTNIHGSIMYLSQHADRISKKLSRLGIHHRFRAYPLIEEDPVNYPESMRVYNQLLDLPMHQDLTSAEIKGICGFIKKVENE